MRKLQNIMVTGGCGFIGSNFIHYLFEDTGFDGRVINVDKLTYAGNPANLVRIEQKYGGTRYFFERVDIVDFDALDAVFDKYDIDTVIHFAAESHVDRSIHGPKAFIRTNVLGTFNLLEQARKRWRPGDGRHFHHISTDEVYGSAEPGDYFYETTAYSPRSPYSASKAAADHLVRSYANTYGLSTTVTIASNNYGPYQFPEKLLPLMINNMLEEKPLPVYGDGMNVRDWLYVGDHCSAVWMVAVHGKSGQTYNAGGENEWTNIELVQRLCGIMEAKTGKTPGHYKRLITFVKDRPGHDRRYALNCDKIKKQIGWKQSVDFEEGLDKTVDWYLNNRQWVENVKTGEYREWIRKNYSI